LNRIVVGLKRAVDYNVRVRVRSDGSGVETEGVKMSINPFRPMGGVGTHPVHGDQELGHRFLGMGMIGRDATLAYCVRRTDIRRHRPN
jgi:hypothetical protein